MKYSVPFIKPSFPSVEEMSEDYKAIIDSNWFTNFGTYERKLCMEAARYIGNDTVVTTVANATQGLDLAVRALFTKTNDGNKVIMPSFTFSAGANVLVSAGFEPVFIDIEKSSWQPDICDAEEYISNNQEQVRGILYCNVFGVGSENIAEWEKLADKFSLPLIIDSAAGFGSEYPNGEKLGSRGHCEVFSMHATKPFSVGEGGLVVSKSKSLIDKIRILQNFGFVDGEVVLIGTNAKLQELSCAIGCRQILRFDERLAARRTVLREYKIKLSECGFEYQINDENSTVPFLSVAVPNSEIAELIKLNLSVNGIEARSYYRPLHSQQLIKSLSVSHGDLSETDSLSQRIVSLPVHDYMSLDVIDNIVDVIKSTTGKNVPVSE